MIFSSFQEGQKIPRHINELVIVSKDNKLACLRGKNLTKFTLEPEHTYFSPSQKHYSLLGEYASQIKDSNVSFVFTCQFRIVSSLLLVEKLLAAGMNQTNIKKCTTVDIFNEILGTIFSSSCTQKVLSSDGSLPKLKKILSQKKTVSNYLSILNAGLFCQCGVYAEDLKFGIPAMIEAVKQKAKIVEPKKSALLR